MTEEENERVIAAARVELVALLLATPPSTSRERYARRAEIRKAHLRIRHAKARIRALQGRPPIAEDVA